MVSRPFRELSRARAQRARELAVQFEAAREPLLFFAAVAEFQASFVPVDVDWAELPDLQTPVCELIRRAGTNPMKKALQGLLPESFEGLLRGYWRRETVDGPECLPARILLQPWAYSHSIAKETRAGEGTAEWSRTCPRCAHFPQVGLLRGVGHGQALSLVCALCLHEWPSPRNICTACGKEGREVLAYYSATGFRARSLQCCNACSRYLQLIDLEEEAAAVADADEMAGLVLDVWAGDQGFKKQQLNLAGI